MSNLFNDHGHLTPDTFKALKSGLLDSNDMITAAEHLGHCLTCADALTECYDESELAKAPSGFAQQVHESIKAKQSETKIQFVFYSLRVLAAVCAALFIVFSSSLTSFANGSNLSSKIKSPNFSIVNAINSSLRDFSQKVISMEDFHHAKEKK